MTDTMTPPVTDVDDPSTGRLASTRAYRPWVPTPDARRPMAVDLVASVALGLVAVNAFAPTYGAMWWLTIGGVGILAGALVTYLVTQFRLSPITTVIAVVVGFFLFGASAVPDTAIAGFLPGPGTPGALFDGITHGWARLLTTVPPVGTIDHLGAIVHLGGCLATGGSLLLARRTRSSWLPLLPPIVVMVAAILVGTAEPASTLAQGAGVAVISLLWASNRGARVRPRVHVVGSNAWTRRLTGAVFVLLILGGAVVASQVQPFAGPEQRFVLRRHTEPPFDPNRYPSPLVGYSRWRAIATDEGSDAATKPLLEVRGIPAGKNIPIRVATMDTYDANIWLVGSADSRGTGTSASASDRFERVGSDLATALGSGGSTVLHATSGPTTSVDLTVTAAGYSDVWVPSAAGVSTIRFTGAGSEALTAALRFNPVIGSAAVARGITPGTVVRETANVPAATYVGSGSERDRIVAGHDVAKGTGLAAVPEPEVKGLRGLSTVAADLTGGAKDPYAQAVAIEKALQEGYFSDGLNTGKSTGRYSPGHSVSQLASFLSGSVNTNSGKPLYIGNAERYSAAMAALARQSGLPARVVVGFRPEIEGEKKAARSGDTVTFIAADLDAWVEIGFESVGWVAFFPTPPRDNDNIPPDEKPKTSETEAQVQAPPPVTLPPKTADPQEQVKKSDKKTSSSSSAFSIPGWVWLALKIVFYPLIVVALVVGAITGLKKWRRNRRRSRGSPIDKVAGAWAEMLDQLRDLGVKVAGSGTRVEVAGGIPAEAWPQIGGFAAGIDAAMFGPDDPSDASAESIWEYVDTERESLLSDLERMRRWRAQLNLASLKPWR